VKFLPEFSLMAVSFVIAQRAVDELRPVACAPASFDAGTARMDTNRSCARDARPINHQNSRDALSSAAVGWEHLTGVGISRSIHFQETLQADASVEFPMIDGISGPRYSVAFLALSSRRPNSLQIFHAAPSLDRP
jgi:hypothetical protein